MSNIENLFLHAIEKRYAIPAFNVVNAVMFKTIVEVAQEENNPVIIAVSEAHLDSFSLEEAVNNYKFYKTKVNVPIILHLDHGQTLSVIKDAIDKGFPSVMIDASQDEFNVNVSKTKEIVEYGHSKGVFVEAEIGHVGSNYGTSEAEAVESKYTEVRDAVEFVKLTGVDALAVSVGTAHGEYKGTPHINFKRLNELRENINIPLVLHGGSSTGDENLNKCINFNIAKINIFTDAVLAAMENVSEIKNYELLMKKVDTNMKNCYRHYFKVFETRKWGM